MKNYSAFDIEDFVQDPGFRSWALGNELADKDRPLLDWMNQNPEKTTKIRQAKELVLATQIQKLPQGEPDITEGINQVFSRTTRKENPGWGQRYMVWKIAAMITLVMGIGWWLRPSGKSSVARNEIVNNPANASQPRLITLGDGSKISLEKDSKIEVSDDFNQVNRTVYLKGKAFFEIKRNEKKPFLVITENLVTQVLGTSFWIEAKGADPAISVSVRTGKVTVFTKPKQGNLLVSEQKTELIPNQMAVFNKADQQIVRTLVKDPVIINPSVDGKNQFSFQEMPVSGVFEVLEKAYGIPINFDKEKIKNCNLVASLGGESLNEKLDLICEIIHATYTENEGRIMIVSNGCR